MAGGGERGASIQEPARANGWRPRRPGQVLAREAALDLGSDCHPGSVRLWRRTVDDLISGHWGGAPSIDVVC